MDATFRNQITQTLEQYEDSFRRRLGNYRVAYYVCVFGSLVASSLAALVLQLKSFQGYDAFQKDASSILAALAALLSALLGVGGFQRRLQASRRALTGIRKLQIYLLDPNSDYSIISGRLDEILSEYDQEVTSQPPVPTPKPPTRPQGQI